MPIQVATCASNFLWKYNTSNKKDKTLGELAQMIEQKIHLKKHEYNWRGVPQKIVVGFATTTARNTSTYCPLISNIHNRNVRYLSIMLRPTVL